MGPVGSEEWGKSPWSSYASYRENSVRGALGSNSSSSSAPSSMPPLAETETESSQSSSPELDSTGGISSLRMSLQQAWITDESDSQMSAGSGEDNGIMSGDEPDIEE